MDDRLRNFWPRRFRATATILVCLDTKTMVGARYADRELTHRAQFEVGPDTEAEAMKRLIEYFRKDPVACFAIHGRAEKPAPSAA